MRRIRVKKVIHNPLTITPTEADIAGGCGTRIKLPSNEEKALGGTLESLACGSLPGGPLLSSYFVSISFSMLYCEVSLSAIPFFSPVIWSGCGRHPDHLHGCVCCPCSPSFLSGPPDFGSILVFLAIKPRALEALRCKHGGGKDFPSPFGAVGLVMSDWCCRIGDFGFYKRW